MTEEAYAARVAKQKRPPAAASAPKSKYRNKKTVIDGIEFASRREATRYQDLLLMQKAGQISELMRQVEYPLSANGMHVCTYVADYVFKRDSKVVVADAKGMRTDIYKLKRKLMLACHGIAIEEL